MTSKRKNLNELFPEPVRKKRSETVSARSGVQVLFHNIEATILEHIADPHCQNVAIMGPYFSNLNILRACSTLAGTSIVTTYDKYLKSKVRMDAFNELVPLLDARVKTLNRGKGRNKTILHTKAIILLDYEKRPYKTIAGSWNFTQNSENNIETMTVYQNQSIAHAYMNEFERVWSVSKTFV